MAAPFYTPAMALEDAEISVKKAQRDLALLEKEAGTYDDEIDYSSNFRYALFKGKEKLTKAERALKRLQNKLRKSNPMAKRKVSQKTLAALKRGRKTMAANRRAKKKAPARRRNPVHKVKTVGPQRQYTTIKLAAPNSTSGNPRRLYLTYKGGQLVAIFDEGFDGDFAIDDPKMRGAYFGHTYKITPGEYARLNKIRKGGQYIHNPAHGNYLNAIAAKARGGLGREAYQNPVPPLRKNMQPLKNVGRYIIATVRPYTTAVVYAGEFGWGAKVRASKFPTQEAATNYALDVLKIQHKTVVVTPTHTAAQIKRALKR